MTDQSPLTLVIPSQAGPSLGANPHLLPIWIPSKRTQAFIIRYVGCHSRLYIIPLILILDFLVQRRRTRPYSQDDSPYRAPHSPALNEDYLLELRRQAFSELHTQTQAYNDTFVARMQHLESLPQEEQRHLWDMLGDHDHSDNHDKDHQAVLEIIDMLDRNSMNDYGAYLERLQVNYRAQPDHFCL